MPSLERAKSNLMGSAGQREEKNAEALRAKLRLGAEGVLRPIAEVKRKM